MNTEQTAQQLELAAQILRTVHPWEWQASDGEWVKPTTRTELRHVISDGLTIRIVLATPPDNRPIHNPDNLTAEQVGAGYRLALQGERVEADLTEFWDDGEWLKTAVTTRATGSACFRLPLSVPWPEAKPDPYADEKKTVPLEDETIADLSDDEIIKIRRLLKWFGKALLIDED